MHVSGPNPFAVYELLQQQLSAGDMPYTLHLLIDVQQKLQ